MKSRFPGMAIAWLIVAAVVAAVGAGLWWAQVQPADAVLDRFLAQVEPVAAIAAVAAQVKATDLFAHFNIPLWSFAIALGWVGAVMSAGAWTLRLLRVRRLSRMESAVYSFGAGYAVLGLATLFVGWAGFARPGAMGGLLAGALVLGLPLLGNAAAWCRGMRRAARGAVPGARVAAMVCIAAAMAAACGYALVPPTQSDAMRYHLAAPQEFLKAGRIGYIPYNAFSNFPFLPEMHYLLALGCDAPEAAQLMHVALLAMAGLAAGLLCRRVLGGRREGRPTLLPWFVAVGMPASLVVASWPFIDHAVTFFFVLALDQLLRALARPRTGSFVLAGTALGAAIGCKYTALPYALTLGCITLTCAFLPIAPRRRSASFSAHMRAVMLYTMVAFAVSAPWFVRNIVNTGNPVYPIAHRVFRGGEWTEESARFYSNKMAEKGERPGPATLVRSPYDLTVRWTDYEGQFAGLGFPALLIAAVGGVLLGLRRGRHNRGMMACVALAAAGYYATWFVTYQSNRMLVPMAMLCVPLAALFVSLAPRTVARAVSVLLALAFAHGALWAVQYAYVRAEPPALPYLLGGESRERYMARALSCHEAYMWLNERVRPGERVLLVGEHRVYGARFDAVWSDWFDTPAPAALMRRHGVRSVDDFRDALRREGIRWVYVNQAELRLQMGYYRPRFSEAEWAVLQDFVTGKDGKRITLPPESLIVDMGAMPG